MRRSAGIVCALLIVLAGCAGIPTGDTPTGAPTVDHTDTTTSTTEPCRKTDRRPHPGPPETLTEKAALQFVEEYVEVTVYNRIINEYDEPTFDRISVTTNGFIVNTTEGGYVVHIRYTFTSYYCDGTHGDGMGDVIDLFLNESVLVMNSSTIAERPHTSDPSEHDQVGVETIIDNGTVLQRWNESSS